MERLPDDLLMAIFSKLWYHELQGVLLASRRLAQLCIRDLRVLRFDLGMFEAPPADTLAKERIIESQILRILSTKNDVHELTISSGAFLTTLGAGALLPILHCVHDTVRVLDLDLTLHDSLEVIWSCKRLEKLSLGPRESVPPLLPGCKHVGERFPHLVEVQLFQSRITEFQLASLPVLCPRLHTLRVFEENVHPGDSYVSSLVNVNIRSTKLVNLKLYCSMLLTLVIHAPKLQVLSIRSDCEDLAVTIAGSSSLDSVKLKSPGHISAPHSTIDVLKLDEAAFELLTKRANSAKQLALVMSGVNSSKLCISFSRRRMEATEVENRWIKDFKRYNPTADVLFTKQNLNKPRESTIFFY